MVRSLTPDNEAFLDEAIARGQYATREEALNAAVMRLRAEHQPEHFEGRLETAEEKKAWLDHWISNRKGSGGHFVDDSRESIYEGCGE